jgi:hypothetical protein
MRRLLLALVFVGSLALPSAAGVLYDSTGKPVECATCGKPEPRCPKCYGVGRSLPLIVRRCGSCGGRGFYHGCAAINQTPCD